MRVAVLQTGRPPESLVERFGTYPDMIADLLGSGFDCTPYDVTQGAFPEAPQALVVTGSAAGVYEPLPWIAELKAFLQAHRGRARMVGLCFGHQIMAEAFGGRVIKSPKGWGVGLNRYRILAAEPWMEPGGAPDFAIPASHQDQVVAPPPDARVFAASDFTAFAGLAYGEDAVSFQGHPEFSPAYAQALIETRRGTRYSDAVANAAIASLSAPGHSARVGGWIRRFLQG